MIKVFGNPDTKVLQWILLMTTVFVWLLSILVTIQATTGREIALFAVMTILFFGLDYYVVTKVMLVLVTPKKIILDGILRRREIDRKNVIRIKRTWLFPYCRIQFHDGSSFVFMRELSIDKVISAVFSSDSATEEELWLQEMKGE